MKSLTLNRWLPKVAVVAGVLLTLPVSAEIVGNEYLSREISVENGKLQTKAFVNLRTKERVEVPKSEEFRMTCIEPGKTPIILTAADFSAKVRKQDSSGKMEVVLQKQGLPIAVKVTYRAEAKQHPWMRKEIEVKALKNVRIDRIEVERLEAADLEQPYQKNEMTSQGPERWRPPLGQPVYAKKAGAFFGTEFPAARNEAANGTLSCGYLTKIELKAGETAKSYPAVFGVADDAQFVKEAFFDYIDATRARPLRLQTQYNSWFDYGQGVDAKKFASSVQKVNQELMVKRGVSPLKAYVIDDGWQDCSADWSGKDGVWQVNGKFDKDFKSSKEEVAKAKSHLGLWLSPGSIFGAQGAIGKMKEGGWKSLDPWMSMTGESYMSALEKRMVSLASSGVDYFKLDGIFGHLNTRNFDIEGFKGAEAELNDHKYDDAKELYLSLGSERLMKIFKKMGEANPDVYIVISNGAYLSPWWLQSIDTVWMINADDAAGGSDRRGELVYRDARYYKMVSENVDNTQFPLSSIFNHEPKKTSTGESPEQFASYLYMNLARGTGFVELYLVTSKLSDSDWDVLAGAMKWAQKIFPTFKRAHMIGGDPAKNEVYGYTGWAQKLGYLALHNPGETEAEFSVVLDRKAGMTVAALKNGAVYKVSSPLSEGGKDLGETIKAGQKITVKLPSKTVRVWEFSKE